MCSSGFDPSLRVTQLARTLLLLPALLLSFAFTACTVTEVCPNGWMTFFVDEQAGGLADHDGTVCDENTSCVPVTGFWKPCTGTSAFCGLPNYYACLSPGDYSYTLHTPGDSADVKEEGNFTLPVAVGTACKIRVYVNSGDPRLQTLSCGAGQILPHSAEGFIPPEGGTEESSEVDGGSSDAQVEPDGTLKVRNTPDGVSGAIDGADATDAP